MNALVSGRIVLGFLLALVAAAAVLKPWGGSEEELQKQRNGLQLVLKNRRLSADRLAKFVQNVERTRTEADQFIEPARVIHYSTNGLGGAHPLLRRSRSGSRQSGR